MVFTVIFIVSKFSTCMASEWCSVFLINEPLLIWFICCFWTGGIFKSNATHLRFLPDFDRWFMWKRWLTKQPMYLGSWNKRQEKLHSSDNSVIGHSPVCHFTLPWTKNSLTSQHALPLSYLQQIHNNETGDFHAAVRSDLISALGDWLQLALPHLIINLCHH